MPCVNERTCPATPHHVRQDNKAIFAEMVKQLAQNLDLAEQGLFRGRGLLEYNFNEQGGYRSVLFNNKLIARED